MNLFMLGVTLLVNLIAVLLIYQFVKKIPKKEIAYFIGVSFGIIYIFVSIAYAISGIGMDKQINESAKNVITFLFVPVNVILIVPFVATKYTKFKLKQIKNREFAERVVKMVVVGLILVTIECVYFRVIKKDIAAINSSINKNEQSVEKNDEEINEKSKLVNQIVNDIVNETIDVTNSNTVNDAQKSNSTNNVDNTVTQKTNTNTTK